MWINWTYTDEKPYPETPDTKIHVRFNDGMESLEATPVEWWHGFMGASNFNPDDAGHGALIVAYKVVD